MTFLIVSGSLSLFVSYYYIRIIFLSQFCLLQLVDRRQLYATDSHECNFSCTEIHKRSCLYTGDTHRVPKDKTALNIFCIEN